MLQVCGCISKKKEVIKQDELRDLINVRKQKPSLTVQEWQKWLN